MRKGRQAREQVSGSAGSIAFAAVAAAAVGSLRFPATINPADA